MALTRATPAQEVASDQPAADTGQATSGAGWMQNLYGNSALMGGIGAAVGAMVGGPVGGMLGGAVGAAVGALQSAQQANQQTEQTVPTIGSNNDVTATTVRTALTNNPRALSALDQLTADTGFQALPADQQGALLAQFQTTPNGATSQYLRGLAAYHTTQDKTAGLAAYQNALNPDSGTVTMGGQTYTIQNGQLMDANGGVAGDIHTDGTYQLTGQEQRSSIYDDVHARVQMLEGTGQQQRNLLDLHDADPRGKLDSASMNGTFTGMARDTIRDLRRENIDMRVTDGFRSFQEQDALYAQGRTAPGQRVTGARGGQSWHNYGVAADLAMQDGNGAHWRQNGEYAQLWQRYGEIAQNRGLTWGGDWTNQDLPHIEYHPGYTASNAGTLSGTLRNQGLEAAWDRMGIGQQP